MVSLTSQITFFCYVNYIYIYILYLLNFTNKRTYIYVIIVRKKIDIGRCGVGVNETYLFKSLDVEYNTKWIMIICW